MKKNSLKIQDFNKQLNKAQLIKKLAKKNIKGGAINCPPPFGINCPPPFGG